MWSEGNARPAALQGLRAGYSFTLGSRARPQTPRQPAPGSHESLDEFARLLRDVAPAALDDEQRAALGILRVDFRLRPRIQVRRCRLKERNARTRHGVRVVQLLRLC